MAQDLQKLKDNVWYAKKAYKAQEKVYNDLVSQWDDIQASLAENPDADHNPDDKEFLAGVVKGEQAKLESLLKTLQDLEAQLPREKYNREQHPILKNAVEKEASATPVIYNTGDIVEGLWRDGVWYKAKIITILGSASAPKYKIKYLDYAEDDTVNGDKIRPPQGQGQGKRKRDPEPAPAPAPAAVPVTSTPHVISGPASVNPKAQATKADISGGDNVAPFKKRKIPNEKQLEKGVSSWKNWNSKGVGKKISQKDSMFRTGNNFNSRVGFTGSGGGMTETTKRTRPDNKIPKVDHEERD